MIYLHSCNQCNVQYVRETTLLLHKRISVHRSAKSGCKDVIKHSKDICVSASFSGQIIEVFPGNINKNNKVSPVNCENRLDRWNLLDGIFTKILSF